MTGTIRIGISGWTYARWRRVFYPERLPHRRELAYSASRDNDAKVRAPADAAGLAQRLSVEWSSDAALNDREEVRRRRVAA